MLYLFDLDGTLISSYMDNPDHSYSNWRVLPRRADRLAELRKADNHVGVITNQAGVGLGYIKEDDWYKKSAQVCVALGLQPEEIFVAFGHKDAKPPYNTPGEVARRKPAPMMLIEAMEHFGEAAEDTFFVGDHATDEAAAHAAGVMYWRAENFFARAIA